MLDGGSGGGPGCPPARRASEPGYPQRAAVRIVVTMGPRKDDEQEVKKEDRSASPPGWPNMPGRSQEHERKAGNGGGGDADVTEQQRELERTTKR